MSDGALSFAVTDQPSPEEVAFVEDELVAYNVSKARPYDRRPLHVFVRDAQGRTIGGITGETNWGWLYVDCFWLPNDLRGEGWGERLLAAAEDEARQRRCRHARLFSYSFQAPGFYEKLGYRVFGVLEDYPPGERQVWLRKDL
jgi:ribosomal protein S18 acetylase RimI-like enzyme